MKHYNNNEIEKHINCKIESFRKDILKIAKAKQWPYISSILHSARLKFQEHAKTGVGTFLDDEVKFL